MAKVDIDDRWLTVRVTWLERWLLSEKPRRCPLSRIRGVDPHPALLDMLLHWTEQRGVWLYGATTREGYRVPSTRDPSSTLAIEVIGERTWYVELDDQEPAEVAAQIQQAIDSSGQRVATHDAQVVALPRPRSPKPLARGRGAGQERAEHELATHARLAAVSRGNEKGTSADDTRFRHAAHPDKAHDLPRIGGWLLGTGAVGMLAGAGLVAMGAVSGLLIVGAGFACSVLGGLARRLGARHPG